MAAGAVAGRRPALAAPGRDRGRRTEIEELNGYVVAEGKRLGVPTPFNEAIAREVTRHGVGTLQPGPEAPGADRGAPATITFAPLLPLSGRGRGEVSHRGVS